MAMFRPLHSANESSSTASEAKHVSPSLSSPARRSSAGKFTCDQHLRPLILAVMNTTADRSAFIEMQVEWLGWRMRSEIETHHSSPFSRPLDDGYHSQPTAASLDDQTTPTTLPSDPHLLCICVDSNGKGKYRSSRGHRRELLPLSTVQLTLGVRQHLGPHPTTPGTATARRCQIPFLVSSFLPKYCKEGLTILCGIYTLICA